MISPGHDWQVTTYTTTLIDGTDLFSATLVCECGYQTATDTEHLTPDAAEAAVVRVARWSPTHGDL